MLTTSHLKTFLTSFRAFTNNVLAQHATWRSFILSLPIVALLFVPTQSHAALPIIAGFLNGALGAAGSIIAWIVVIYLVAHMIAQLVGGIFLFLINFLVGISQYNSFLGSPIVTLGWTVTRDFANLFLVIALLVIAFATILNVQSYQASSLMKKFLFAAIAVNFSKMICGVMLDAAQVVMMTFVSGYSDTAAGNFVNLFQIKEWLALAVKDKASATSGIEDFAMDIFATVAGDIFAAVVGFFGILAVISLVAILVVRIITIWFLIIAAPLAFVAQVLPATASYASQWWSAFYKQLIAGPIVAFLVWVSLASVAISKDAFNLTKDAYQGDKLFGEATAITISSISKWETLGMYFVPIVLFIMGAKWAVSMSGGMAQSISNWAGGKLKGYAGAGVGWIRRQSVGGGKFSVGTQAWRGATGRNTLATPLTDGLAYGVGKGFGKVADVTGLSKHAWAGKVANSYNNSTGSLGRAAQRADIKSTVSNFQRAFEVGKEGEEQEKIREATENSVHLTNKAKAAYDREMADIAGQKFSDDPAEQEAKRAQAERSAFGRHRAAMGKANESRKEAVEGQKKNFVANGLKDPIALVDHIKDRVDNKKKPLTAVEREAADEMIKDHYEKEESKRIAEERARVQSAGGTFDEAAINKIKGEVAAERTTIQSEVKLMNEKYGSSAEEKARESNIAKAKNAFKSATTEPPVKAAITAARDFNDKQKGYDLGVDRKGLIKDITDQVGRAGTGPENAASHRSVLLNSVGVLHPVQRTEALRELMGSTNAEVKAAATAVEKQLREIDAAKAVTEFEQKNASREKKGDLDRDYVHTDIGLSKNAASGHYEFQGESGPKFAAAIRQDAKIIAKLSSDVSTLQDVRKEVGAAMETATHLEDALEEINRSVTDVKERAKRFENVAKAALAHSPDAATRSAAQGHIDAAIAAAKKAAAGGGTP